MRDRHDAGFAAIPLLVSLLVIGLILFVVMGYLSGRPGGTSGRIDRPIDRAQAVECLAQVRKVQMLVQLYSAEHGRFPEGLEGLEGLVETDRQCPLTQRRFGYDPGSGRVSCPDHPR